MGKFIQLTDTGAFAGDLFSDAAPTGVRWTRDLCPHGMYAAIYQGGTIDDETGEVIDGAWIDSGGPDESMQLKQRLALNNAAYTDATDALTADYPQREKDTWPTQNEQAAAWVADPDNAATPWIDRAAAERGIGREEYLRRTLVKAEQFKILSAFLTGRRQRYEDQIKLGNNPVLDYVLTNEVMLALQQVSQTIMATPAADMQGALK